MTEEFYHRQNQNLNIPPEDNCAITDENNPTYWRSIYAHTIEPLELPEPAKSDEVPDWLKGMFVSESPGYENSATLHLIVDKELFEADINSVGWEYIPSEHKVGYGRYVRTTESGIGECHHASAASLDPELGWVTKQEEGYAGRHFKIKLQDGRLVTLRGPWHGSGPNGHSEVTIHYQDKKSGFFGTYIQSEKLVSWLLLFCPDWTLIKWTDNTGMRKEPQVEIVPKSNPVPRRCRIPAENEILRKRREKQERIQEEKRKRWLKKAHTEAEQKLEKGECYLCDRVVDPDDMYLSEYEHPYYVCQDCHDEEQEHARY